jgi:hypothetical protein
MDSNASPFSFSLEVKQVEVELVSKERGTEKYSIREMTGLQRDQYLTSQNTKVKFNEAGKPVGLRTFDGCQSSLLSRCMYKDDVLVPEKVIQTFPSTVLQSLYEMCQKLNGLDTEADTQAKKD